MVRAPRRLRGAYSEMYAVAMADQGMEEAMRADPVLARGVNTYRGSLTNEAVAQAHGLEWTPVSSVIHGAAE